MWDLIVSAPDRCLSFYFEIQSDEDLSTFEVRKFEHQLLDIVITEEKVNKVNKVINKLKGNKPQGPDNIHPRLLKETGSHITRALKLIFRNSLDE